MHHAKARLSPVTSAAVVTKFKTPNPPPRLYKGPGNAILFQTHTTQIPPKTLTSAIIKYALLAVLSASVVGAKATGDPNVPAAPEPGEMAGGVPPKIGSVGFHFDKRCKNGQRDKGY
ncbi:hypothetical protein MY3296_007769 [Beauveria thailandica]